MKVLIVIVLILLCIWLIVITELTKHNTALIAELQTVLRSNKARVSRLELTISSRVEEQVKRWLKNRKIVPIGRNTFLAIEEGE